MLFTIPFSSTITMYPSSFILGALTGSTIYGTASSETLIGTSFSEKIYGYGGNDFINAGGGSDSVDGGAGTDFISGGEGDDYIFGGEGDFRDILSGNAGRDSLFGQGGNDDLWGDADGDYLTGGAGADTFRYANLSETMSVTGRADMIRDFNMDAGDRIDLPSAAGSYWNYERFFDDGINSIEAARASAERGFIASQLGEEHPTYLYIGNRATDTGFLLIDGNGNGQFEAAIVLEGAGQVNDFNFWAII